MRQILALHCTAECSSPLLSLSLACFLLLPSSASSFVRLAVPNALATSKRSKRRVQLEAADVVLVRFCRRNDAETPSPRRPQLTGRARRSRRNRRAVFAPLDDRPAVFAAIMKIFRPSLTVANSGLVSAQNGLISLSLFLFNSLAALALARSTLLLLFCFVCRCNV